ncbi:DUF2198 family protein [Bacillus sp. FSL H8-0547]
MLLKAALALVLPFVILTLFARVTYNHYVAAVLTIALLAAAYTKGYMDSWILIALDAVSVIAGFMYAAKMAKRTRNEKTN